MKRLTSATAIGMILAATPALAEVTPKSVWENLNSYYQRYGMTVETASVDEAGDTVTVKGLVLTQKADGTSVRIESGDLVLTATGDGAVRMDVAEDMAAIIELPAAPAATDEAASDAEPATDGADAPADSADAATDPAADAAPADEPPPQPRKITLTGKFTDDAITVREDGDAIVYDYLVPKVDMTVTQIELDDGQVIANPVTFALTGLKGTDRIEGTESQKIVQAATAESLTVNLDVKGEQDQYGKGQVVFTGFEITSDAALPVGAGSMTGDLGAMLKAGLAMKGAMKFASMTGNLGMRTVDDQGQPRPMTMKFDGAESALNISMDQSRINYAGTNGATNAEMTIPELPVPLGYGIASGSFDIDFPVAVADAAQNFAVAYKLDGLTLTDSIWGLFDPQAALPRDPASLEVDLAGSVKVLRDFFDMSAMNALNDPNLTDEQRVALYAEMSAPPVDLRDITINKNSTRFCGLRESFWNG